MGFWEWLFSRGRVAKPPKSHTAGRFLAPSPVTRAYLDLKAVNLPTGVVETINGGFRAVAEVTGYPLHARSDEDALSFLALLVDVLNQLPHDVVLIGHSAPGGLEAYAFRRRARAGLNEGPMALLLNVQSTHAMVRMAEGTYRTSKQYLVSNGKTPQEALLRLGEAAEKFEALKIKINRLVGHELATAIAESWRPRMVQHAVLDFNGRDGDVLASIAYSPGASRLVRPRYVDTDSPPLAAETEGMLPSDRKRRLTQTKALIRSP